MGPAPRRATALAAALLALACGGPAEEAPFPSEPAPVAAGTSAEATGPTRPEPAGDPAAAAPPATDPGLAAEGLEADVLSPSVTSEPETRIVPLESLLRAPAPKPAPRVLDLRQAAEREADSAKQPAERGVTDAVRERLRLERRSEHIGRTGPEQGTYSETEAGVDVPVGEGVKLRGGVRVEERDEPADERRERESTPQVGVEIEF